MSDDDAAARIDLIATLLDRLIANLGYPVGCGVAPHPETTKRMAEMCLRVATAPLPDDEAEA